MSALECKKYHLCESGAHVCNCFWYRILNNIMDLHVKTAAKKYFYIQYNGMGVHSWDQDWLTGKQMLTCKQT